MGINRVVISGNLTRDPELLATGGRTPVLRFGVAVSDRVRNKQTDKWEDRPNFVDCVVFGARAEALSKLLAKGRGVSIDGRLRYSAWETEDGQRRSRLEVVAENVVLAPRRDGDDKVLSAEDLASDYGAQPVDSDLADCDIPF